MEVPRNVTQPRYHAQLGYINTTNVLTMETLQNRPENLGLSSSPAFATPLHPLPAQSNRPPPAPPAFRPSIATILPILLPPPTLRPLAFRTFTKKHNLTLSSSALQALATFIGRNCGSGWREEGTGERVLEEVAKLWKSENGGVIVQEGDKLKAILKTVESCMVAGRVGTIKTPINGLSRQSSFAFSHDGELPDTRPALEKHSSFGLSSLQVEEPEEEEDDIKDPRAWLEVISAFSQPRFAYDSDKKHFTPITTPASTFPSAKLKTALFKERYNIISQRLLRNEAFQAPSFSRTATTSTGDYYKITPIANLLGRTGSSHLLLGLLVIAPTGTLALNDPSGSISLDLTHASPLQASNASFCPGMIVLVDGVYEENFSGAGASGLGNTSGIGGTIGGRFIGFSISGPPVEKRKLTLGLDGEVGGGFGWTDWLGFGSERAVGERMRRLETRLLSPLSTSSPEDTTAERNKMIILSDLHLDSPTTLTAFRKLLAQYSATPPMSFCLIGNFSSHPALAGTETDSIRYKELFDSLAAIISDFPHLLQSSTWIFVPGDNDAWSSSFSAGAASLLPQPPVPDVFTLRVRRAFAAALAEKGHKKAGEKDGEAVWTSNPARLSLFGPAQEVLIFRDDFSQRLRRNAVAVGRGTEVSNGTEGPMQDAEDTAMAGALPTTESRADVEAEAEDMAIDTPHEASPSGDDYATQEAKKLIISLLPQSTLSPFPATVRPVHWDYASSALSLYPLPDTLVLADAEAAAFTLTFEGCHVVNPGRFVTGDGRRGRAQWVEYDFTTRRGVVRSTAV